RHTSFSRDWSSDVCSSDLCFKYLWYPAMAIIAALSVQYSNLGINTRHLYCSPMSSNACRNPELADTPPAIAISFTPVCFAAFFSLFSKIVTIRYCTDAQISYRCSSIKFGFRSEEHTSELQSR